MTSNDQTHTEALNFHDRLADLHRRLEGLHQQARDINADLWAWCDDIHDAVDTADDRRLLAAERWRNDIGLLTTDLKFAAEAAVDHLSDGNTDGLRTAFHGAASIDQTRVLMTSDVTNSERASQSVAAAENGLRELRTDEAAHTADADHDADVARWHALDRNAEAERTRDSARTTDTDSEAPF